MSKDSSSSDEKEKEKYLVHKTLAIDTLDTFSFSNPREYKVRVLLVGVIERLKE